ncbi:alpha/beta fold hydrolase [Prauserella muralis]|uniref:Alpha/beta hydrolase n=1 Tax=Prauserella muralis TaxID=588067 RepID=A0A2V4AKC6_9PSEU|nr:alpha/beta fold hydrolase [Prauserella muralis]PXY20748.1 alpha/beta hydrolase [Prauserella muralis]TWE29758.1 pimeloyl-ACP methyl ester carboxylesterase [Prauserella muralis]
MTGPVPIYRSARGRQVIESAYQEALRSWPVPARQHTVTTAQGDTFVIDSGAEGAPPAVLLHGSGTNTAMWRDDVATWAEHVRVLAVDLIGEPGLSAPARPPLGSAAYAAWLDEVLDARGLAEVSLVGASLGGWLALDYATRRPHRVRRLVCLCPGGIGRQKVGWLPRALLLRRLGRWGQRKALESVAGLTTPEARPLLDAMVPVFREFRPRTQRLPVFTDEQLATLTMPTLIVAGERDAMFDSQDTARRAQACLPSATVRILPGVGHSIIGQTETILAFLRDEGR